MSGGQTVRDHMYELRKYLAQNMLITLRYQCIPEHVVASIKEM